MNLQGVLEIFGDLINLATPIVVALALLFFFWGLATYILNANDEKARKEARAKMIYGLIALFLMVSVWGIINVIRDTFDLDDSTIDVPQVDIDSGSTR